MDSRHPSTPSSVNTSGGSAAGSPSPSSNPRTAPADPRPVASEAQVRPRAKRGFAVLSPEKKREIASMGGKAAHEHGRAHRFTSEEARAAGKRRHQLRLMALAQAGTRVPGSPQALAENPSADSGAHPASELHVNRNAHQQVEGKGDRQGGSD